MAFSIAEESTSKSDLVQYNFLSLDFILVLYHFSLYEISTSTCKNSVAPNRPVLKVPSLMFLQISFENPITPF